MRFDSDYREELALPDGTRLILRSIKASDKAQLESGLARMSPESRYQRFFSERHELSTAELRYLTELDGVHRFAIVVGVLGENGGEGRGVAVARYVEFPKRAGWAEPALAITDELHGQGLGRRLFARLMSAAAEHQITNFECEVLASNRAMRRILERLVPNAEQSLSGAVVTYRFPTSIVLGAT